MRTVLYIALAAIVLLFVGAQMGLLRGTPPTDLGVHAGRLAPPSPTRNSVSSQARLYPDNPQHEQAWAAPFALRAGDPVASMKELATVLHSMPGVTVTVERDDYLRAEAETRWLKFVDDLEFWFNPVDRVIEVRSASRLGSEDFGVNRKRIEAIRAAWLARP